MSDVHSSDAHCIPPPTPVRLGVHTIPLVNKLGVLVPPLLTSLDPARVILPDAPTPILKSPSELSLTSVAVRLLESILNTSISASALGLFSICSALELNPMTSGIPRDSSVAP